MYKKRGDSRTKRRGIYLRFFVYFDRLIPELNTYSIMNLTPTKSEDSRYIIRNSFILIPELNSNRRFLKKTPKNGGFKT